MTILKASVRKTEPSMLQQLSAADLVKQGSVTESSTTISDKKLVEEDFENRKSPWGSLWLCNFVQFLCGIQFAIYFTSMWPYLSGLDKKANLDFLGIIVAVFSIGQSIASPVFGFWSQKTLSTKHPSAFGLVLTAIGNLLYALLPTIKHNVKWYMLASRIIVGVGSGNLSVLRAYTSTASTDRDRNKALALGIASFVFGQSMGPAVQAIFSPIGEKGIFLGPLQLNMYTVPAYFMIILSVVAIVLLYSFFKENYAGIMDRNEETDPYAVLPKFDKIAAVVLIYMWYVQQSIVTTVEVMASPLTIAMYNWDDGQAILYNGLIQSGSCIFSVINYFAIAYTRLRNLGNRRMIIGSIILFLIHYLINFPWPFYGEHLDYIKLAPNSTVEDTAYSGGCYARYTWCEHTTRIPLYLYVFSAVFIFGLAFPYFATPTGTIYSQVLGPRNQGFMQGVFALFGSVARCISPLITTNLFEDNGYLYPNLMQSIQLVLALLLTIIFYRRLIPLRIVPKPGIATTYKRGIFYHF